MTQGSFEQQLEDARALDAADPLRDFRAQFCHPARTDSRPLIYLCGHSLGLAPRSARGAVTHEVERWQSLAVNGHDEGEPGWISYAEDLQQPLSVLAGASPDEVVAMNSLSVNLHLLLGAFYRPRAGRRAILIEAGAFSSDRHVVASQIAMHGGDPQQDLIELAPRSNQELLTLPEIEHCIAHHAERLALVLWPGVQFRTGQYFDPAAIARSAHAVGAVAGFDLAHAIGNLPLSLHDADADFAAWCSYKFLNAGPGAIGGAFIHERHLQRAGQPHLAGWWGHEPATRFDMPSTFQPARGAAAWAISNPPIFSAAALRASLPLFQQATMDRLRVKSCQLTAYLETQLRRWAGDDLSIVTPSQVDQRGCQLSLRVTAAGRARQVFEQLRADGVIADWRAPDIIRVAPVPLYNGYEDALRCARLLGQALRHG